MDTSKEYITMCKAAHEVQVMRVPMWGFCKFDAGDYFTRNGEEFLFATIDESQPRTENVIWLPKQDQLQEMFTPFINKIPFLVDLMKVYDANHSHTFTSLEQLWLAILMQRHFNKQWDNEKSVWIKCD